MLKDRLIKVILDYQDFWKMYLSKYLIQIPYIRKLRLIEIITLIHSVKRVHYPKGKEII